MKVLFMISHPAHFHIFKNTIGDLQKDGHSVVIVIRPKDMLEQLCIQANVPYVKVDQRPQNSNLFRLGLSLLKRCWDVCKIVKKEHPNLLMGSDGVLAVAGKIFKIPSFELFDDDYEIIKMYADLFFPLYTSVIAPKITDAGKFSYKKIEFDGYKKLAYLWPTRFSPSEDIVKQYGIDVTKPYFILRFAKLTAHHDVNIHGFSTSVAENVINMLAPYGKIYITSERELEPQFEKYRLKINPLDIHHVLAFASIYIGDSQTMACEAGILGTPFVRYNDFVGKINYMAEMEDKYHLGIGVKASPTFKSDPTDDAKLCGENALYSAISALLVMDEEERIQLYTNRRNKMLSEKIDVATWLTWFIENYPQSATDAKREDFDWNRFK